MALEAPTSKGNWELQEALNYSGKRGAIIVSAAGNQGSIGGTALTQHPCVIPVVAYDREGRPMSLSNLGSSIGRRGLGAPGEGGCCPGRSRHCWGLLLLGPGVALHV